MQRSNQATVRAIAWRHRINGPSARGLDRPRGPSGRLRQLLIPVLTILLWLPGLPVQAAGDTTVILENDDFATPIIFEPLTDGEYVLWQQLSQVGPCETINAVNFGDPNHAPISYPADFSSIVAADTGYLAADNPFSRCKDDTGAGNEIGLILKEIATGESRYLSYFPFPAKVAIDYPYVAWMSVEMLSGNPYIVIRATDVTSDEESVEILGETVEGSSRPAFSIVDDTVYWASGYGPDGVGYVARARIGGAPSYFMSLIDTTEVVLSGDIMVTLTENRPKLQRLSTGEELWLADEKAHNLATDGRYIFWSPGTEEGASIVGFDTQTDTHFSVWDVPSEGSKSGGWVTGVNAHDGAVVWLHEGYGEAWVSTLHGSIISDLVLAATQPGPDASGSDRIYYPEPSLDIPHNLRAY